MGLSTSGIELSATAPVLGSTVTITVENIPVSTPVGVILMSASPNRATSLLSLPNNPCWLDLATASLLNFVPGVPSYSASHMVPSTPALIGKTVNLQG